MGRGSASRVVWMVASVGGACVCERTCESVCVSCNDSSDKMVGHPGLDEAGERGVMSVGSLRVSPAARRATGPDDEGQAKGDSDATSEADEQAGCPSRPGRSETELRGGYRTERSSCAKGGERDAVCGGGKSAGALCRLAGELSRDGGSEGQ